MGSKKMGTDKGIDSRTVLWNVKPVDEHFQAGTRVSSLHQTQATFIRTKDFDLMLKDKLATEFFNRFAINNSEMNFIPGEKITAKIVARMIDSNANVDDDAPGQLTLDSEIVKQQIEEAKKKGYFFLSDEQEFLNPDQFVAKFSNEDWEYWPSDWERIKPDDHLEALAEEAEAKTLTLDATRKAVAEYAKQLADKKKAEKEAKDKAKK